MKLSIDKTTVLAIIIPMVALLLVGYISYQNTIQFIQKDAVDDRINSQLSLNEFNILKGLIEAKLAELNQTTTLRQLHGINAGITNNPK
jgi:CHASE3 domain sensor protein